MEVGERVRNGVNKFLNPEKEERASKSQEPTVTSGASRKARALNEPTDAAPKG